jgi:NAD(P)H-dependent FMN reductase
MKIQVIFGSTREGRQGEKVAQWFFKLASKRTDAEYEFIDLRDWQLPMFNNPHSPMTGKYVDDIVKKWSKKINEADGYVIVTPEYNHGYPAVLKNALDHLYKEWNNKPIAFVGYGASAGGGRAIEQLRLVAAELHMASIRESILIPAIWDAFDETGNPKDISLSTKVDVLLDQLLWWSTALKEAREKKS